MASRKKDIPSALRTLALRFPETTEGASCTKVAFKARNKSFLFVEQKDESWNAMLRLSESLPEAEELAAGSPENYFVGKHGWTTLRFENGAGPDQRMLKRWVTESFCLLAPKTVLRTFKEVGLA